MSKMSELLSNYKLVALVGEGSFGKVYKGKSKKDGQIVAIKRISKAGRERELKTLRSEVEIQRKLKHPNVIDVFESFETNTEVVLITEYAHTDLHKHLGKNGSLPEDSAKKLACQLVSALYYLHSNRILHRDLKPQNVLLTENMSVKLCDFGLARSMTEGTHVLTSIKGTPLYMAPEILADKSYDHQADLWSLGCIIYETMAGQPPFSTNNILLLVQKIRTEEVKWPSFLSTECQSFLQGLLEKEPSLRSTWAQIICNPFLEGQLYLEGCAKNADDLSKDRQNKLYNSSEEEEQLSSNLDRLNLTAGLNCNLNNSQDSINANIQTDVENFETDVEDIVLPFSNKPDQFCKLNAACYISGGNNNMIINHLQDNFSTLDNDCETTKVKPKLCLPTSPVTGEKEKRNKDLEKRKLSQNLENFSLRLGDKKNKANESMEKTKNNGHIAKDSYDDSPMLEAEEWLAFMKRNIHELLEGDFGTISELSMVIIIMAPLRHPKASSKVIESIVHYLSLVLVLGAPAATMDKIKMVYSEVKLVPNLMYAIKLLISIKSTTTDSTASSLTPDVELKGLREISDLSSDELKTISRISELICHLVYLKESFLSQYCDAVTILPAYEIIISFLNYNCSEFNVRISSNFLAMLMGVVLNSSENCKIVENILLNNNMNLVDLIEHKSPLLRLRCCMLFRVLAKNCKKLCLEIWNSNEKIKKSIENLRNDENGEVEVEAKGLLEDIANLHSV